MTLGMRKLVVLALVAGILLVGNLLLVARWLEEQGVIEVAREIRQEFLTGTAITILVALLILLVPQKRAGGSRSCPVCDSGVPGGARYCGECGSRVVGG